MNPCLIDRHLLVETLRAAERPISGQALADSFGVSRVAVFQHIEALRRLDYPIYASPRGYRMEALRDQLHEWNLPQLGERYRYFEVLDSTMNAARSTEEGTIVAAGRQTSGRGRLGRRWESSSGGLFVTLVLERRFPLALAARYMLVGAAAAAGAVQKATGLGPAVSWPNDIHCRGRKIGGVLVDLFSEGDEVVRVHIGLGLNVNGPPPAPGATSLETEGGRRYARAEILLDFVRRMDAESRDPLLRGFRRSWQRHALSPGRRVQAQTATGILLRGRTTGVDAGGSLVIESTKQRVVSFHGCVRLKYLDGYE